MPDLTPQQFSQLVALEKWLQVAKQPVSTEEWSKLSKIKTKNLVLIFLDQNLSSLKKHTSTPPHTLIFLEEEQNKKTQCIVLRKSSLRWRRILYGSCL